jgi:hypothetical protein
LLFALPLLSTPTADDHVKFIMEPLTRAVQRKRTSADDRDKDMQALDKDMQALEHINAVQANMGAQAPSSRGPGPSTIYGIRE